MRTFVEITSLSGFTHEVDTSTEACQKYGVSPDEKYENAFGEQITIIGIGSLMPDTKNGPRGIWFKSNHQGRVCCTHSVKEFKQCA